jgi:hypothetical protein
MQINLDTNVNKKKYPDQTLLALNRKADVSVSN